ncbi:alpha/beta hydrolase [Ahniella affigens]|uniref:Alpha/beta hydrolase n=2 Tax=Ahniella affigens TaxID=2021234 RepID=A0A2P1PWG8_9GAMM|nr:alpha/beta hydrolase [Ahniella affigens]
MNTPSDRAMNPRKPWWRWPALLLGLGLLGLISIYWFRPGWLLDADFARQRWQAGLSRAELDVGVQHWVYVEGGQGDPVLLVHGLAGSKENWYPTARLLSPNYHLLIPDLPGFGESPDAADGHYQVDAQVERLHAFVTAKGWTRFHLAGHSMGGHIAGLYAAKYPESVRSLSLVNAAGVPFPRNAFQAELEQGGNPFAATDLQSLDRFLAMAFAKPPFAPARVRAAYAERIAARAPLWRGVLRQLITEDQRYRLQTELPNIKAPTLVLWCDQDALLDVLSTEVFRAEMPTATINVLKGCGHMTPMEAPTDTAAAMRAIFATAAP